MRSLHSAVFARAISSERVSRSFAITVPEVNFLAIRPECPPRPAVVSRYTPSGRIASSSIDSAGITGTCIRHLLHSRLSQLGPVFHRLGRRGALAFYVNRFVQNFDVAAECV